ncbi:MAG: hypothetical protein Q4G19_02845 [Clostridia bacterium]|nr:hypothetical protein [Clostridia bacterium]
MNNEKEKYQKAQANVVIFDDEDILVFTGECRDFSMEKHNEDCTSGACTKVIGNLGIWRN